MTRTQFPRWLDRSSWCWASLAIVVLVGLAAYLVTSGSGGDASRAGNAEIGGAAGGSEVTTTAAPTTMTAPDANTPVATHPEPGTDQPAAASPAALPTSSTYDVTAPLAVRPSPPATTLSPADLAAVSAWWSTLYFGGLGIADIHIELGDAFDCEVLAGAQLPVTDDQKTVVGDLDDLRTKLAAAPTLRTRQLAATALEALRGGLELCASEAPADRLRAASATLITAKEALQAYVLSL